MGICKGATLVLNYKRTSTYALNVVVGPLETALGSEDIEIVFARNPELATSAAADALGRARRTVVGWSFYSPEFRDCSVELAFMKRRVADQNIVHLAGGVHSTAEPEQTLRAGFDYVALGEGEATIIDFMRRVLKGEDLTNTKGIASLDNGRYLSNGPGERVDLNDYPPFALKHGKFNPIEITRGCIYACRFCQTPFMFKARFRHRSVENICYYVGLMKDRGLTDVRFITPTALSYGSSDDSVRIEKIDELLSSVRGVIGDRGRIFFGTFPSEVRPEHVSREALHVLKRYVTNDNLIIGGQSGSQRILDLAHRGHTVDDIVSAVEISLEVGFIPNVDFIFGLPHETATDVRASLRLAERLSDMGARIHGHTFMPLPGTPFMNAAPGVITPAAMRQLKRLESRGRLYGQWRQQASIAQGLAQLRRHGGEET